MSDSILWSIGEKSR